MQNLSHDIERYIIGLLEEEEENFISLRRKELAEMFECVPSQINYVLRSRFTPEQGYLIESRRGEHGYIKILRITCGNTREKVDHINEIIGDEITFRGARKLLAALPERTLPTPAMRTTTRRLHTFSKVCCAGLWEHRRINTCGSFTQRGRNG